MARKQTTEPNTQSQAQNTAEAAPEAPQMDEKVLAEKIAKLRSHVRESFGKVVMAMMSQPRYRHHTLADLAHLVLEPLTVDRIAMAYARQPDNPAPDMAGMAIWASVSEEVDQKIREQIRNGTFPIRLKANEWISGDINWLLDVIAVDQKTTGSVIANFKQVAKTGDLRLHPIITRLVDKETLEKIQSSQQPADVDA